MGLTYDNYKREDQIISMASSLLIVYLYAISVMMDTWFEGSKIAKRSSSTRYSGSKQFFSIVGGPVSG